jgi:hypothetical protein
VRPPVAEASWIGGRVVRALARATQWLAEYRTSRRRSVRGLVLAKLLRIYRCSPALRSLGQSASWRIRSFRAVTNSTVRSQ